MLCPRMQFSSTFCSDISLCQSFKQFFNEMFRLASHTFNLILERFGDFNMTQLFDKLGCQDYISNTFFDVEIPNEHHKIAL